MIQPETYADPFYHDRIVNDFVSALRLVGGAQTFAEMEAILDVRVQQGPLPDPYDVLLMTLSKAVR